MFCFHLRLFWITGLKLFIKLSKYLANILEISLYAVREGMCLSASHGYSFIQWNFLEKIVTDSNLHKVSFISLYFPFCSAFFHQDCSVALNTTNMTALWNVFIHINGQFCTVYIYLSSKKPCHVSDSDLLFI